VFPGRRHISNQRSLGKLRKLLPSLLMQDAARVEYAYAMGTLQNECRHRASRNATRMYRSVCDPKPNTKE
jgi:hypothetical protein